MCLDFLCKRNFLLGLEMFAHFRSQLYKPTFRKRTFLRFNHFSPVSSYEDLRLQMEIRHLPSRSPSAFLRSGLLSPFRSVPSAQRPLSVLRITSLGIRFAKFTRRSFVWSSFLGSASGVPFRSTPFGVPLFVPLLYHVFFVCQYLFKKFLKKFKIFWEVFSFP